MPPRFKTRAFPPASQRQRCAQDSHQPDPASIARSMGYHYGTCASCGALVRRKADRHTAGWSAALADHPLAQGSRPMGPGRTRLLARRALIGMDRRAAHAEAPETSLPLSESPAPEDRA